MKGFNSLITGRRTSNGRRSTDEKNDSITFRGVNKSLTLLLLIVLFPFFSNIQAANHQAANTTTGEFLSEYKIPQALAVAEGQGFLPTLFKLGFSLAFLIVLIYLVVYGLKVIGLKYDKSVSGLESNMLTVLDSLPLGYKKAIHLINIYNKRILIVSLFDKEIRLLDKIEEPGEVTEIINKIKEKYATTLTFKEHFNLSQKKFLARQLIKKSIADLTGFFQRLQKPK